MEGKQYFAFLHVFPCSSETVEVSCYIGHAVFKLVETRSIETSLLLGLGYANVSLTHSLTPV